MTKARCANHKNNETFPAGCQTCRRIQLEATIVKKVVKIFLGLGCALRVNDGESLRPELPTLSATEILAELMETDEDYLEIFNTATTADDGTAIDGKRHGWVRFVYGNDGWDVINDYTTNLEDDLKPVNDYADRMSGN